MMRSAVFMFFLLGTTVAAAASISGRVLWGLILLVPLMPLHNILYRFHEFYLGKDFIDIILLAMIAGWALRSLRNGERLLEPTPLNGLLVATACYTLYSLWHGFAWTGMPVSITDERVATWKNYMILPVLYFITVNNVTEPRQIKLLLAAMAGALIISDYYTLRQIAAMSGLASRDRLTGTFVWLGPNQVAAFYVQSLLVMLGIYICERARWVKAALAPFIVLSIIVTLFLYSRGAYLAVAVGIILISLVRKRALVLPLLLIFMFAQALLPKNVLERIGETRTAAGELDSSSQKRLELWKESLKLFASSPLTGIGFDGIAARGLQYGFRDTHNIYMKILAEQGLAGMALFLGLLWLSFKGGVDLYRRSRDPFLMGLGFGFAVSVIAVMTTNLFGDRWTYLQVGTYFWVSLGLVQRGLVIAEREGVLREAMD